MDKLPAVEKSWYYNIYSDSTNLFPSNWNIGSDYGYSTVQDLYSAYVDTVHATITFNDAP